MLFQKLWQQINNSLDANAISIWIKISHIPLAILRIRCSRYRSAAPLRNRCGINWPLIYKCNNVVHKSHYKRDVFSGFCFPLFHIIFLTLCIHWFLIFLSVDGFRLKIPRVEIVFGFCPFLHRIYIYIFLYFFARNTSAPSSEQKNKRKRFPLSYKNSVIL